MNKQVYLQALEQALTADRVADIGEILAEYKEHFDFKTADGFTEEEVADRLEKPEVIAMQFASADAEKPGVKNRAVVFAGLFFTDLFVAVFFAVLFAWTALIGAFSLASAIGGFCMITGLNVMGLIPLMPYLPGLAAGICCLCLSVLSAAGAVYCWLYFKQLIRAYIRWHGNTLSIGASGRPYPPLSKHPRLSGAFRRRLRGVSLAALAAFGFTFIISMILLFAYAGFLPFWHAWGWFL
jgi:uncharacterized membrane protein